MPRTDENGRQLKALLGYLLEADRFRLSYPDLQIRFGLVSHDEVTSYLESVPFSVTTVREAPAITRRPKLSELTPRSDAPPL